MGSIDLATTIDLTEAIGALRAQITAAHDAANDTDIRFAVGPVEMEFTVTFAKEARGGVSVKVLGVGADGGGAVTATHTHRVRITLTPQDERGEPIRVAADGERGRHGDYATGGIR